MFPVILPRERMMSVHSHLINLPCLLRIDFDEPSIGQP